MVQSSFLLCGELTVTSILETCVCIDLRLIKQKINGYLAEKCLTKLTTLSTVQVLMYSFDYWLYIHFYSGRHGGIMFSVLDSGSKGPGSSPGRVIVFKPWPDHHSWERLFTLTVPRSTHARSINGYQQTFRENCWA